MSAKKSEALLNDKCAVHGDKPAWARLRAGMRKAFPSPYRPEGMDPLTREVASALQKLDALKPENPGPGYLSSDPSGPHYEYASGASLAPKMQDANAVIEQSVWLFRGMPLWNHPLVMHNVVPQPNVASIVGALMAQVFNPNAIEGEDSWNVEVAELEATAMLARLAGWDAGRAGGIFTFGGTGCYFYALKYAMTRVLGTQARRTGIREDVKLLASRQGHYCKMNTADWSGLGTDNVVEVETDMDTNAMDVDFLESTMERLYEESVPVACVVCTMGTTDANAMDPAEKVRRLMDKYPNPEGYGRALLYCDAVIGWPWLAFGAYDLDDNPLGFSEEVLPDTESNYEAIKEVVYADAIGCYFHKSGWAPYVSSIFLFKDGDEFVSLMKRPGSDYVQERTPYNLGKYTLEAFRSGAPALAAWSTLKYFGYEGFQAVLSGILEMQKYLRDLMEEEPSLACVNPDDHGLVTLFRVYPKGADAKERYHRELTDHRYRTQLIRNNKLQDAVAERLYEWFRSGKQHAGSYAPYLGYCTGFRPTDYNRDGIDPKAVVYALKAFPMNMNVDHEAMRTVVKQVLAARDEVEGRV